MRTCQCVQTARPVVMHLEVDAGAIVQTGTGELTIGDRKAERPHQVQRESAIGGQTHDVAGVGWNFGLIQDDVEHGCER